MRNIYDLFDSRKEELLDLEYNEIQESCDKLFIIETSITETLEYMVYHNPEKKKLSVLIEEAEANEVAKTNSLIDKLKEQMKKVMAWIMNIFNHNEKLFEAGANFVNSNDLNQCMLKIKQKRIDVTVSCHPQKATFQRMQSRCLREINVDRFITKRMRGNSEFVGNMANDNLNSGDKTDNFLASLLTEFKMDKENFKEVKLDTLNVLVIHNNLNNLPAANKKLENIKTKVQRLYNQAINDVRQHARTKSDNKASKADNELAFVNSQIKQINERIRAYAKIMTYVFKEDYNLAKLIVAKSKGQNVESEVKVDPVQTNEQSKPSGSGTSNTKADSGVFRTKK